MQDPFEQIIATTLATRRADLDAVSVDMRLPRAVRDQAMQRSLQLTEMAVECDEGIRRLLEAARDQMMVVDPELSRVRSQLATTRATLAAVMRMAALLRPDAGSTVEAPSETQVAAPDLHRAAAAEPDSPAPVSDTESAPAPTASLLQHRLKTLEAEIEQVQQSMTNLRHALSDLAHTLDRG